jgi:hypothetical protein
MRRRRSRGTYFPARGGGPHRFRSHCLGTRAVIPARSAAPSPSLRRTARRSDEILASQESLGASRNRCSVSAGTRGRPKAFPLLVPLALALATPARKGAVGLTAEAKIKRLDRRGRERSP